MKIFCSDCGTKHEYSTQKPKFCSECGGSMGGESKAKRNTPQIDEEDDDEGYSDDLNIPTSIAFKIDGVGKRHSTSSLKDLCRNPVEREGERNVRPAANPQILTEIVRKARTNTRTSEEI